MDRWMNGWMNGWMDGWMDEWMNGWMGGKKGGMSEGNNSTFEKKESHLYNPHNPGEEEIVQRSKSLINMAEFLIHHGIMKHLEM